MDRGAWWAAVHRVAQSRTWLKRLRSSSMQPILQTWKNSGMLRGMFKVTEPHRSRTRWKWKPLICPSMFLPGRASKRQGNWYSNYPLSIFFLCIQQVHFTCAVRVDRLTQLNIDVFFTWLAGDIIQKDNGSTHRWYLEALKSRRG